jgi:hypothetical protein
MPDSLQELSKTYLKLFSRFLRILKELFAKSSLSGVRGKAPRQRPCKGRASKKDRVFAKQFR